MTNAEKYEEVFGIVPEICNCPTHRCEECPEFTMAITIHLIV